MGKALGLDCRYLRASLAELAAGRRKRLTGRVCNRLEVEVVIDIGSRRGSPEVSCVVRGRSRSIARGAGFSCSTIGYQSRSPPLHMACQTKYTGNMDLMWMMFSIAATLNFSS